MKKSPESGIYCITNKANGKVYVGSAVNIRARWRGHLSDLRKGRHHSRYLQAAWWKYGDHSFEFSVLEIVADVSRLLDAEDRWIASADAANRERGYNLCKKAGSQLGMKHSDAARKRMSIAHCGRVKSPEHQDAINKALAGRKLSSDHIKKIVATQNGRKVSDATRQKMRDAHANPKDVLSPESYERMVTANIGREFTKEHRAKIGEANRLRTLSAETRAKISASRKRNEQMKREAKQHAPLMGYELRSRLDPGLEGPGVPITLSKAISMLPNQDGLLPPFGNGSAKATEFAPHQQRVIEEKAELDTKLGNLIPFLSSDACHGLPFDERGRLHRQSEVMREYSSILGERVAAFGAAT